MKKTIRTIDDLAQHLGAHEATSKAIARRIYKDTSCGCSASFDADAVIEKHSRSYLRTYTVECRNSFAGTLVLAWRPDHGKKRLTPRHPDHIGQVREIWSDWNGRDECGAVTCHTYEVLPLALAQYMLCSEESFIPIIGDDLIDDDYSRAEVARDHGRGFLESLRADAKPGGEGIVRVTRRGPLVWFITVRVLETRDRLCRAPKFSVSGYCEGIDIDCDVHEVFLPCTPDEIDAAISQADKDGNDLWAQTHGCQKCHPKGTCDEYGNEFSPDGDNWVGQPINPDCVECEGSGVAL